MNRDWRFSSDTHMHTVYVPMVAIHEALIAFRQTSNVEITCAFLMALYSGPKQTEILSRWTLLCTEIRFLVFVINLLLTHLRGLLNSCHRGR